jgi:hypothetical protein
MSQSVNQFQINSRGVESLVDFITSFRHELGALASLYGQLPDLIAAEHDAVISGNFNLIRQASDAKMQVCDKITTSHEALLELSRRLPGISEAVTGQFCAQPATLSAALSRLVDLAEAVTQENSGGTVQSMTRDMLQRLLAGSTSSLEFFLDVAAAVKPRIEANRILLQKLAKSYQDSYRFWVEMAAETQAPYDARGVQRFSSVASGIQIKA